MLDSKQLSAIGGWIWDLSCGLWCLAPEDPYSSLSCSFEPWVLLQSAYRGILGQDAAPGDEPAFIRVWIWKIKPLVWTRVWLGEWDLFFEWNAFLLSYSREVLYKYQYRWRDVQSGWYIFSKYIEHHKGKKQYDKQIKRNYCYLRNNGVIITPQATTIPCLWRVRW